MVTCCAILVILLLVSRKSFEHLVEVLYVFKTKQRFSNCHNQKGIRKGETRPSQGQRAELMALRISKEDPFLSPGSALREQGKVLATKRMKGMGDGKARLTIRAIRCS